MISIIVDNYKRSYLLPLLIQTYNRQGFNDDEVEMVIVDDYSNDHFEEFLKLAIEEHAPWFKVRALQTHKVVTYNQCLPVNVAVKKSHGDIIILNHSDVVPCRIDTLKRIWDGQQREGGAILFPRFIMNIRHFKEHGGPLINGLSMPKSMFMEIRGFDEKFYGGPSEDIDFIKRLRRKFEGKFVTDREILYLHLFPIAEVPPRMREAPWKPDLGVEKEDFNLKWIDKYNNDLVNINAQSPLELVNHSSWGELDTLEEIEL